MSDGGGESEKQFEENFRKKKSGTDVFAQAIAKIAVAQVCESVGFPSFQQLALNTLSDVAVRYICSIGMTASLYANLAGRADCNVFDIIQGLEDLGSQQGFVGASDVNHCLASSGTVQEIIRYVGESEEIPFAYSVPGFPIVKDRKPNPSFMQVGEMPPAEHIPAWLPAFPNLQAYEDSPSKNERDVDNQPDNIEAVKEFKRVKQSRINSQQHVAYKRSEVPSAVDPGVAAKGELLANSNPFLSAPLQLGEKKVSLVALPAKLFHEAVEGNRAVVENHVSAVETFAPAIEAVKSRLCDSEEGKEKILSDKRLTVKFKFGIGKKSSGTPLSSRNNGDEKFSTWFGNDNDKDDKKRRAGQILKESMKNPHELAQL